MEVSLDELHRLLTSPGCVTCPNSCSISQQDILPKVQVIIGDTAKEKSWSYAGRSLAMEHYYHGSTQVTLRMEDGLSPGHRILDYPYYTLQSRSFWSFHIDGHHSSD
jgi:hypothetical protein